jgi:hypothetical protein
MSKVILEFDSVEESDEIQDAINGWRWKNAMWDLDQNLRNTTKYGKSIIPEQDSASSEESAIADRYRELIREILQDNKLYFD